MFTHVRIDGAQLGEGVSRKEKEQPTDDSWRLLSHMQGAVGQENRQHPLLAAICLAAFTLRQRESKRRPRQLSGFDMR